MLLWSRGPHCRVSRPGEQPGRALHAGRQQQQEHVIAQDETHNYNSLNFHCNAGPVCCADGDDTRAVPGHRWCLLTQLFLVFPPINK